MKTPVPGIYKAPEVTVVLLRSQGIICTSGGGFGSKPYQFGGGGGV